MNKNFIGNDLEKIINKKGIKENWIAGKLGFIKQAVSNWVIGKNELGVVICIT